MARITEIKTISIHDGSYCNPVCLQWLNSLGGYDVWVFEDNQTIGLNTREVTSYQVTEDFLESSDGFFRLLGKEGTPSVVLTANMVHNTLEMPGMKGLLKSKEVWEVEADGSRRRVRVRPGSVGLYRTDSTYSRLTLTIEREKEYSQLG